MQRTLIFVLSLGLVQAACSKSPTPEPQKAVSELGSLDAGTSVDAGPTLTKPAARAASAADAGPPLEFVGVVRGVVKLAKGSKLPLAPFPQQNGITPPSVAPCPPVDATDQRTVSLAKQTGGLFPVHVALTGMSGFAQREPVMHELYIDACRIRPTMVAAMRGDEVRITNRTETPLVPRLPGASFMRGLMRGETHQAQIKQTRSTVDCSFGSYCGESLVIATSHTLATVTTAEGFFSLDKVPLDQDLKVYAWNPLFDVTSAPFRLTHAQPEQMIELTLTPSAAAAATRAGPPPKGAPPPVRVHRLPDGGVFVTGPGPAYE